MFGGGSVSFAQGEKMWDEIMREVDSDNSGSINYTEFKECMFGVLSKRASFVNQK